jgi:glycosyltransferase involved in cell wall biosynthesis
MRIAFLLPGRSVRPAGGFKVVYEYANRLVARGHEVAVVHPWDCTAPASWRDRLRARRWVSQWGRRREEIAPWFEFDPRVELPVVTHPAAALLPAADVLVATAWHTASWVAEATAESGAGVYLIQGYETWDGEVETVRDTWRLPLRKVTISRWLEEIAAELGEAERTDRVPLGMDLDRLGVDVPQAQRQPRLGALYNSSPEKRSGEVVAAMEEVRARHADASAVLFGTAARPSSLPDWIEYEMLPSQPRLRELYNSCAVFLQASRSEGWGLPASEAILCGCALVTVENGGSREFARDGETALVVAPGDVAAMAEGAGELLGDAARRQRLAGRGAELLSGFTWERSVTELERVLAEAATPAGAGTTT